ncbi:MAG: VOC family protein [Caulobacteraceae bacterium]
MSEQTNAAPPLAVGHVALSVADLKAASAFYSGLGLRVFSREDDLAIFELRGGTHLLLLPREVEAEAAGGGVDLMIAGKTRADLEAFRDEARRRGLALPPIIEERRHGHWRVELEDPDGHAVTVYTSHTGDLPI